MANACAPRRWVIRERDSGKVLFETGVRDLVRQLSSSLEAVPMATYLKAARASIANERFSPT